MNHAFHDMNSTTEKQEKDLVRQFQSKEWIKQTSCRKIPKNRFNPIVHRNDKQFLYLSPCRLSEKQHLTQRGDLRKNAGILRWSTYFHRWIPCTLDIPARLEELQWEKWAWFLVSVESHGGKSSVLAALISQPVQTGAKLICWRPLNGRNRGTHERWCKGGGTISCKQMNNMSLGSKQETESIREQLVWFHSKENVP